MFFHFFRLFLFLLLLLKQKKNTTPSDNWWDWWVWKRGTNIFRLRFSSCYDCFACVCYWFMSMSLSCGCSSIKIHWGCIIFFLSFSIPLSVTTKYKRKKWNGAIFCGFISSDIFKKKTTNKLIQNNTLQLPQPFFQCFFEHCKKYFAVAIVFLFVNWKSWWQKKNVIFLAYHFLSPFFLLSQRRSNITRLFLSENGVSLKWQRSCNNISYD